MKSAFGLVLMFHSKEQRRTAARIVRTAGRRETLAAVPVCTDQERGWTERHRRVGRLLHRHVFPQVKTLGIKPTTAAQETEAQV